MSTREATRRQEARLRALLRRQDGVIALAQAIAHGISAKTVRRLVASGRWRRLAHCVYQDATHENTLRARVRAVMLSLGDHAVLVGEAAAWWWGLQDQAPTRIEVAVGHDCHRRPRPDTILIRRTVPDRECGRRDGLRVTTVAATVLDAAAVLGTDRGARLMDRALQRGRVSLETLRRLQVRRSGRRGAPITARLIALASGGAVSEAERLVQSVLLLAGILGWVANFPIDVPGYGRARVDLAFREQKVIVEVDGWAYHRGLRAFLIDGPRQTALTAAGWVVVRTHWYELTEDPQVFVDALGKVLAAR
ncbi:type IV toxin-antitoxin system AbiEi family antitoxin domain-containing protein [Actinomycetospora termitidis]|uniref:Type IV toxin-antitoxin system AbiEi family antitoxin domain-containing protein n=1 Tax=Actinomycetospora termitidis TaxID=3053470 RepID=A0ABT7M7I0_9PSEU|nr:type IV toxin-antitoxin system AbiEi family antitoxin domain-containing protein [Actinomycetospora sp. Odt1-22]MDL5155762.1 type IV toxin-antitoxin system AbiEi family antitoxin domain-containing protein [Actinomycetospora sp. Odt1-22]